MGLDRDTRDQLITTIRRFVDERLIPAEAAVAESDAMPPALVDDMRGLGLFGLSIPEEFGGLGLSMEDEALVVLELGRAAPAFRSMIATNVGIGCNAAEAVPGMTGCSGDFTTGRMSSSALSSGF